MGSVEEKVKARGFVSGAQTLFEEMKLLKEMQDHSGVKKAINSELWHACAGPLVNLPPVGSLVYYFPQGHSEQVAVSTNRSATSQIPNYPNLPSQLLCQVHNITLHADKDTDEIYAQMSLQPVSSEKDVYPVPDFGFKPSKHPTEFFCKTLTASDTSTHGGFSVPRRAAEKLFPALDFSMQPPTQELVVRDLHENTWTFRHIYRGQPKRHLLTTGWSMFVGAKRLRAGDSVLFIRDEKSHLLLGVRRANRQQSAMPSSVLSADSMHIGVLAAAAHAAANRSLFSIFYNPRACPSEFVVPMAKYRKAVYGTQLSVGMRFGMMFETEESSKRRHMGTIIGISELDPVRWPGSKWRNVQVEWDESGCNEKQNRVNPWEIETPESLFIFPSLTSSFKRPFQAGYYGEHSEWDNNLVKRPYIQVPEPINGTIPYPSISSLWSEQLVKMLMKPQGIENTVQDTSAPAKGVPLQEAKPVTEAMVRQKSEVIIPSSVSNSSKTYDHHSQTLEQPNSLNQNISQEMGNVEVTKVESLVSVDQLSNKSPTKTFIDQNNSFSDIQTSSPLGVYPQQLDANLFDCSNFNGLIPLGPTNDWNFNQMWDNSSFKPLLSQTSQPSPLPPQEDLYCLQNKPNSNNYLSDVEECLNFDGTNGGNTMVDPSVSSTILDEFCSSKEGGFQNPSDYLVGNFSASDVQSQITSASLPDSRAFSLQDFPDSSGGASSSNADLDESALLQNSSWQPPPPPVRTYTKIQKAGSVGRSIDVSGFKTYDELLTAIERMFGLEGLLNDRGSGWKLVYVDFESDVLLVGDDPWEEFVSCVRCIRILSPSEVQKMSEEGMQLLVNNTNLSAGTNEPGCAWDVPN